MEQIIIKIKNYLRELPDDKLAAQMRKKENK